MKEAVNMVRRAKEDAMSGQLSKDLCSEDELREIVNELTKRDMPLMWYYVQHMGP